MARTPLQELYEYKEGLEQSALYNYNAAWQDAMCGTLLIEDVDLTAPPAVTAADDGKVWIPAATATGAWAGKENQLALLYNAGTSWGFIDLTADNKFVQAFIKDDKELRAYSPIESQWYPVGMRWTDPSSNVAAEHWTGGYFNGSKRYAKSLSLSTLPNNTTKTWAHSITSMDVSQHHAPCWEIWITDGTSVLSENFTSVVTLQHTLVVVDATNVAITTNYNASGSDGFIRLEYCKTA